MKIKKNLLQSIANGETILTGEPVARAQEILAGKLFSDFYRYAFSMPESNHLLDVQDAILDYSVFGHKITFVVPKEEYSLGKIEFFGMRVEDSLTAIIDMFADHSWMEDYLNGKIFRVRGSRTQYKFDSALLYAYEAQEALEKMKVA